MGAKGGPKTGGRVAGVPNKKTSLIEQAVMEAAGRMNEPLADDAFKGDGVDFLQRLYRDSKFPMEVRMEAATRAAKFERPIKTENTVLDNRRFVVALPEGGHSMESWRAMVETSKALPAGVPAPSGEAAPVTADEPAPEPRH